MENQRFSKYIAIHVLLPQEMDTNLDNGGEEGFSHLLITNQSTSTAAYAEYNHIHVQIVVRYICTRQRSLH